MLRQRAGDLARSKWREAAGGTIIGGCVLLCAMTIVLEGPDHTGSLSVILGFAAVAAGVLTVGESELLGVSASFIVCVLAAAFLGPASAALAAIIAEFSAAVRYRSRWQSVALINLPTNVTAAVLACLILRILSPHPHNSAGFFAAVLIAGLVALVSSFALFSLLRHLFNSSAEQYGWRTLLEFLPGGALSILLAVAGVGIALNVGNSGIAFALAAVFAFAYMAHLLEQSRNRAKQYVSLSWGVLATAAEWRAAR